MITILVVPDSFKESLSAANAASAIVRGIKKISGQLSVVKLALADGGEGTLDCLLDILDGVRIEEKVTGPIGTQVVANWGLVEKPELAIVELAQASGLELVPRSERDALRASSYGTGQLLRAAFERRVGEVLLTLGGSATTDGGMGALSALGVRFLDSSGRDVGRNGGQALNQVAEIDSSDLIALPSGVKLSIACDVNNPLYGPTGAAYVYSAQKGASPQEVELLDRGLRHFASILESKTGREVALFKGAGAAGGIAAGLKAFFEITIKSGFEIISRLVDLEAKVAQADLIITAEGEINSQTLNGKVPYSIGLLAKKHTVPVIALCGNIGSGIEPLYENGLSSIFSVAPGPISLAESIAQCAILLESASERAVRLFLAGRNAL